MPARTIGLFQWRRDWADLWLCQCEGPWNREHGPNGDVEFRPFDREADHLLLIGPPVDPAGGPKMPYLARKRAKLAGRHDAERLRHATATLGRAKSDMTMLVYEPACAFSDAWFETAAELFDRVYAPDDRATHPIVLPSTWSFTDRLQALRDERPIDNRPIALACVTSGKRLWPGHDVRLDFLRAVRAAGIPMDLFGKGLPSDLSPLGPVESKATVYRASRMALVIENDAEGERYVTEKLWDALICWCLPLYHGSRAPDTIIPPEAFVRVPSLDQAGIDAIREALADDTLRAQRLDAMREARSRALGDLRLAAWAARTLG